MLAINDGGGLSPICNLKISMKSTDDLTLNQAKYLHCNKREFWKSMPGRSSFGDNCQWFSVSGDSVSISSSHQRFLYNCRTMSYVTFLLECLVAWSFDPPLLPPGRPSLLNIHLKTKRKSKCRCREISFSMCQISMPAPLPRQVGKVRPGSRGIYFVQRT